MNKIKTIIILTFLCSIGSATLPAEEAEIIQKPLFILNTMQYPSGCRPPFCTAGKIIKKNDTEILSIPAKSGVFNHAIFAYKYGGLNWHNYDLTITFRFQKDLMFSATTYSGGVGISKKQINLQHMPTKQHTTIKLANLDIKPFQPSHWYTIRIRAEANRLSAYLMLNGQFKKLGQLKIKKGKKRGVFNLYCHKPLEIKTLTLQSTKAFK